MAVSVVTNPQIDLFIPQQPLGSGLPIGLWRAIVNLSGDATGGGCTMDIETPSVASASLYMWSIEEMSFTDSPGSGNPVTLTWETGDPAIISGAASVFVLRRMATLFAPAVATQNSAMAVLYGAPRFDYIARPRGFVMRLRAETTNTNLHITQFAAWGYLWHQEYAKAGAARRP